METTGDEALRECRRWMGQACTRYDLLEDGDRILVAVSGGKDSLLLVRLLAERQRIWRPRIQVEVAHVVMAGVPYRTDLEWLERYCTEWGVRLHILQAEFGPVDPSSAETPCRRCALTRRRTLFSFAAAEGFNKVAFGHHQDDFLVTYLLNITYEGQASTMLPSMPMQHYPLTLIRPLCLAHEDSIIRWATAIDLPQQLARCPHERATRRTDMQRLFQHLQTLNPEARYSLWHAAMREK